MKRLLILLFITSGLLSNAQLKELYNPGGGEETTFQSMQRDFENWKGSDNLADVKGWKWYARWQEHYYKRTDGSGNLVDPKVFFKEAIRFQQQKNSNKSGEYAWLPAGPDNLYEEDSVPNGGLGRINCVEFHPSDPNTLYVGVAQGGIWKTTNGGQSWTPLNNGLPIIRISDLEINPLNPDIMYACVGDFEYHGVSLKLDDRKRHTHYGLGLYKSTDGGQSWSATKLTTMQTDLDYSLLSRVEVNPSAPNEILAGGVEGMWRSDDAGETWTKEYGEVISDIVVLEQDPDVVYAATSRIATMGISEASVIRSNDFGETWTKLNTGIPATNNVLRVQIDVAYSDTTHVYAVVCDGRGALYDIYFSQNSGQSWVRRNVSTNILGWFSTSTSGQGRYDLDIAVNPKNKNKVYVGGISIFGSHNLGVDWDIVSNWYTPGCVHADVHRLEFSPYSNEMIACHDGGVSKTKDIFLGDYTKVDNDWWYRLPTKWTNLTNGMQITSFYRLGLRSSVEGQVVSGAQDNGTRLTDSASSVQVSGGDGMECDLHDQDSTIMFTSAQYGNLMRFESGFFNNISPQGAVGEWTTPFVYNEQINTLLAGYEDLYLSYDRGDSWSKISGVQIVPALGRPTLSSALAQSSGNLGTVYMGKRVNHQYNYGSKMFVTHDLGDNWDYISDGLPDSLYITYIYADKSDPDLAWISFGGFADGVKVLKTKDGGDNWENISYDLPNVPVNCIILDEMSSDHRLYLATDLGVFVTADKIDRWIPFSDDLPNVIVSELEIHYPSESIYAATFGRGVWKTKLLDTVFSHVGVKAVSQTNVDFMLFPNPNDGAFTLMFESDREMNASVSLVNVLGKTVFQDQLNISIGQRSVEFHSDLPPGQYHLLIQGEDIRHVEKMIVHH